MGGRVVALAAVAASAVAAGLGAWFVVARTGSGSSPRARAEAAERAGDRLGALAAYQSLTRAGGARSRDFLGEGRALLALDRAREAEAALRRAAELDPADVDPPHTLLEMFRIERRGLDALRLAEAALRTVDPSGRRTILRDLTLALFFVDTPLDPRAEARARETLARWIAADPEDDEARAVLALRMSVEPSPADPDRGTRIDELERRLKLHPGRPALREALIAALADAGEVDRGRAALDEWPADVRDARYDRLRGRWDLEFDRNPARAAEAFARALTASPHDWRTRYRLSRALKTLGRTAEADREAEAVARLRERLEPGVPSARLARDLSRLDDPESLRDLANLCAGVGLTGLAEAWSREAAAPREAR